MNVVEIILDVVLGAGAILLGVVVAGIVLFVLHLLAKELWPTVAGITATVLLWMYVDDILAVVAFAVFAGIQVWWTKRAAGPGSGQERRASDKPEPRGGEADAGRSETRGDGSR